MNKTVKRVLIGLCIVFLLAFRAHHRTDTLCTEAYPYYKSNHEVQLTIGLNEYNLIFEGVCHFKGRSYTDDQLITTLENRDYYNYQ